MDSFKEQLVRAEDLRLYNLAKVVSIMLMVLGFLAIVFLGVIASMVIVAIGGALFYFKRFLYCEYEYAVTNGEVDIDCIYEVKTRKRKITFNIKEVDLLAEVNSQYYKDFSNKPTKILNCVPKGNKHKEYAALVTEGTTRVQVVFIPNKEFLDACYIYNPKAVKRNIGY